ncbi:MAG: hypothetical protein FWB75_07960 [Oscillospiraceae bacterium]|nr:hypothetical protein [Oscillospiraceae bacterium]
MPPDKGRPDELSEEGTQANTQTDSHADGAQKITYAKLRARQKEIDQREIDEIEPEEQTPLLTEIRKIISTGAVIMVIVAVCSIAYGLIVDRQFTLAYVFPSNFIAAAALITAGLMLPAAPNRFVDKLRNRQLVESSMHRDFMESRKAKQKLGLRIMWTGLTSGILTATIELIIWLIV